MQESAIERFAHPEGFDVSGRAGAAQVRILREGALLVRYEQKAYGEFVPLITQVLDDWISVGHRVLLLVDASQLRSYEPDFRRKWTEWFRLQDGHYEPVPILFRSPLVSMGIAMVNPIIGNRLRPLSDAADLDKLIGDARRSRAARHG